MKKNSKVKLTLKQIEIQKRKKELARELTIITTRIKNKPDVDSISDIIEDAIILLDRLIKKVNNHA